MSIFQLMMYKWLDLCTFVPNIPRTSKKSYEKKNSVNACCHPDYLQH